MRGNVDVRNAREGCVAISQALSQSDRHLSVVAISKLRFCERESLLALNFPGVSHG
jgi:hypothetical protein